MAVNSTIFDFAYGEIAPIAQGRPDLKIGQNGLERCQNFIIEPYGPVRYRPGTIFVNHTRRHGQAAFIPFQFNDQQSYLIEATDQFFRFYKDGAVIVSATTGTITGITLSGTGITVAYSGITLNAGDEIILTGVAGTTQVNGRSFVVASVGGGSAVLQNEREANFDASAYTTYVSGGVIEKIYEIASPYTSAHIAQIQYTQNADTMYLFHQSYAPRKLTRSAHDNWTINTYSRTNDPWGSAGNYPRCGVFTADGRLVGGGTINNPETFWGSQAPNASGPRFDDFTTGTNATNGFQFTLAPLHGKVDSIQWVANTSKFLTVGTFGTVRRLYGATQDDPISATSITAKSVDTYGCAQILPATTGTTLFYVQRSNAVLRSFEYDYQRDDYVSANRSLVSSHLTRQGVKQILFNSGIPNILWAVRNDGVLLGLTFEEREDKAGWHQHRLGGNGKVLAIGTMPRPDKPEQLWLIVERVFNGVTSRHVEYFSDIPNYPNQPEDFYWGTDDDYADRYENVLYERQKQETHLDATLTYDGRDVGIAANAALTLSGTTGAITITASNSVFTAAMVGREIWKAYDDEGYGGGRAVITGYTNATTVTASVTRAFDNTVQIPAGQWYLTATTISGAHHLEGQTVQLLVDGALQPDVTVQNGMITLDAPSSYVHIGHKYVGVLRTMNLEFGGMNGPAQAKKRNLAELNLRFLNTVGTECGASIGGLRKIMFRSTDDYFDRPVPLFTGIVNQKLFGGWAREKRAYVVQRVPLPCTLLSMDFAGDTSND